MRSVHESNVTAGSAFVSRESRGPSVIPASGGAAIIAEESGPAIMLVPTEQVLLLDVELPLKTHAKRLAALPFAVEDRIADSLESVHLALGAPLGEDRYLVGVVRHELMRQWIASAEAEGMGSAAMVPDALMLPRAAPDQWNVYFVADRALVMRADGTGFACPGSLLLPAWEAAGRPAIDAIGESLPVGMSASYSPGRLGFERLPFALALLDLRQGAYAPRAASSLWRRAAWVAGIGLAAHAVILLADTLMLRAIANSREAETRALVEQVAPGTPVGEDTAASIAPLLPAGGGAGGAPQTFLPLADRVFGAIAPLGPVSLTAMDFADNRLTLDFTTPAPGDLAARLRAALSAAGVKAEVSESPGGAIRVTASAA